MGTYGKDASYTITATTGLDNCEIPDSQEFCGAIDYLTRAHDEYENLDREAAWFYKQIKNTYFCTECDCDMSEDCMDALRTFACAESFKACDADGFSVPTCGSACTAVTQACGRTWMRNTLLPTPPFLLSMMLMD